MALRVSHFAFDWWIVQKRAVYLAACALIVCLMAGGISLYVWKFGNPLRNVALKSEVPAGARFMSFEGDVRIIRAATRQVLVANRDIQLYPGDTVQTQADGRARISMADGSTVVVRPNSTIIIRDNESGGDGKRSNVHVVVDSGQMLVRTADQTEENKNVIETPKTQNTIGSQTQASFGVNPTEGTEEIRVNSGAVQSANHMGERVTLQGNEYVQVNQSGTISKPQRLLEVPQPVQPRDLEKIAATNNGSATVPLRWQKPPSGVPAYYRVEVATSPFFVPEGKVIERDQLSVTQFSASDLRPGSYFWRIRATAASGQTSDWSEPLKFIVMTAGANSSVPVSNLSTILLGGNLYIIRGTTQPGATVRSSDREATAAADGNFQIQISAPPNLHEVTLQASDSQGNTSSYRVQLR